MQYSIGRWVKLESSQQNKVFRVPQLVGCLFNLGVVELISRVSFELARTRRGTDI